MASFSSLEALEIDQRIRREEEEEEDAASSSGSSSDGSSPLGWPLGRRERCHSGASFASTKSTSSNVWDESSKIGSSKESSGLGWEDKREKRATASNEVELMKERFAKLLLGEDMSGGSKGVCTALAISNAITNLAASVFGELWRLEPLSAERKAMWKREMEWLLSVSDYIVELVPSWQSFRDGSNMEIMVTRPRSDIHINLPALRKLDTMLLEALDSYTETEFWYVEQGIILAESTAAGGGEKKHPPFQRQQEKWWLPTPRVPSNGLSPAGRKALQNQRDCTNQILKAAMAINGQVLSEMEVPELFWESLPKNGKSCLGEAVYRGLTADSFSPDHLVEQLDVSTEHSTLEAVNRVEATIHIWQRKLQQHQQQQQQQQQQLLQHQPNDQVKHNAKSSWGKVKDHLVAEIDRPTLIERAETLLFTLKQRYPGLPQTTLDMNKIQYNKDVGQSILESYSRVLESLAFSILARIDDVMFIDDSTKEKDQQQHQFVPAATFQGGGGGRRRRAVMQQQQSRTLMPSATPYATPFTSPNSSPDASPPLGFECFQQLHCVRDLKSIAEESSPPLSSSSPLSKKSVERSYARSIESSRKLVSPPGRD